MNPFGEISLVIDLGSVTGPIFLGFVMEAFGMGVVLVLALDYLLSVVSRRKIPSESPRRLGVILVSLTLMITTAQTIIDIYRGFRIFGTNFMSITSFLSPDPLWFWSPFLGCLSAVLAQGFLLRRIIRFLSSLELLWPVLSRKLMKHTFTLCVSVAIILAAVTGSLTSWAVAKAGGLASVASGSGDSSNFQLYSAIWLGTAVGIDCVLCSILCVELWWARRKLSMKGTTMQEFMTHLILVTFHGGAAVTGLQVAALLLYYYQRTSSWCYFPMILIYNITLILSISLPQQTAAKAPSAMISLPTIHPDISMSMSAIAPGSRVSLDSRRATPGRYIHFTTYDDAEARGRGRAPAEVAMVAEAKVLAVKGYKRTHSAPSGGKRWSDIVKTRLRLSQGLLSWSLMPGDMIGMREEETGKEKTVDSAGWSVGDSETSPQPRPPRPVSAPLSAPHDRRPSLMPLLSPTPSPNSARLHSPLTVAGRSSTYPIYPHRDSLDPSSSTPSSQWRDSISNPTPTTPLPYPQPTYVPSSPRYPTVHRQSSISNDSPHPHHLYLGRRSTLPGISDLHAEGSTRRYPMPLLLSQKAHGHDPLTNPLPQAPHRERQRSRPDPNFHFDTINPFGSVHSLESQISSGLYPPDDAGASGSQVPLSPCGQSTGIVPDRGLRPERGIERKRSRRGVGVGVEDEFEAAEDDDDGEPRWSVEGRKERTERNMSFQDFLAGVDVDKEPNPEFDPGGGGPSGGSGKVEERRVLVGGKKKRWGREVI